jgi:hypothetical protein
MCGHCEHERSFAPIRAGELELHYRLAQKSLKVARRNQQLLRETIFVAESA